MTFTKQKIKALRRSKRKSSRLPIRQLTRAEVLRMQRLDRDDVIATAVPLRDKPGKVGLWAWESGSKSFLLVGEEHESATALDRILQVVPRAKLVTPQQFHARTQHVRAAMDQNGHEEER